MPTPRVGQLIRQSPLVRIADFSQNDQLHSVVLNIQSEILSGELSYRDQFF